MPITGFKHWIWRNIRNNIIARPRDYEFRAKPKYLEPIIYWIFENDKSEAAAGFL